MEEDIVRFHIPVHNVVFIEDLEGLKQLLEDEEGIGFWEFTLLAQQVLKSASVAVLVDEVEVIGGFEHVEIFDDVGVGFDIGEDVDFVDSALF